MQCDAMRLLRPPARRAQGGQGNGGGTIWHSVMIQGQGQGGSLNRRAQPSLPLALASPSSVCTLSLLHLGISTKSSAWKVRDAVAVVAQAPVPAPSGRQKGKTGARATFGAEEERKGRLRLVRREEGG